MSIHQLQELDDLQLRLKEYLPTLERRHNETKSQGMRTFYEMYMSESPCPECHGARLKKESLSVKVGDKNINELTDMPINKIKDYLNSLKLNNKDKMIADQIFKELNKRLQFLIDVGLRILDIIKKCWNFIRRRSTTY